tara:strand:+ start:514 stop:717 length:204 start_codon:yes stop_codon:yes gene_type:complete
MFKLLFTIITCFVSAIVFIIYYPADAEAIIKTLSNLEVVADIKELFISIDYSGIWEDIQQFFNDNFK